MLDFIKSLDLSEELKNNEIYYLFKTDSSELNLHFLSTLQKFKTTEDFLNYYSNQDCKSVMDIFNNISSISSKLCDEEEKNIFTNKFDKYISELSNIIFLFLILQKHVELLSNLLLNTKKYINKFYTDFHIPKTIKEKINSGINDLTSCSIVASKRNYSRRSTQEGTVVPLIKFSGSCLLKNKQQEMNDEEFFFSQISTPKFEEEENDVIVEIEESKNNSSNNSGKENNNLEVIKEAISKKDSVKMCDSSLTLSKMKFTLSPEFKEVKFLEKTKSYDRKEDFEFNNLKAKKGKSFKKNKISLRKNNSTFWKENKEQKKQILVQFLDNINNLYKEGKINSELKVSFKKSIISDSNKVVDKFINYYRNNNNSLDKIVTSKKILKFINFHIKDL